MSEDAAFGAWDPFAETTHHVRRALDGEAASLDWIIRRFSPLLRTQAAYRLGRRVAQPATLDDVVADAWLAVIPKLSEIGGTADRRMTPLILSYLSTTVRRLANRRLEELARRAPDLAAGADPRVEDGGAVADPVRSAVTLAARAELAQAVAEQINRLEPGSREVVVLRGIEGLGYAEIAEQTGEAPNTLAQRYHRAIEQLRRALPRSVFDELEAG